MDDDDVTGIELSDTEFVDMEGCFEGAVEGIIGIMRPDDDGVTCDVIGVTPSDVIGGLEYGEL